MQIYSATPQTTVLVSGGQQWGEASHWKSLELQVIITGVPLCSLAFSTAPTPGVLLSEAAPQIMAFSRSRLSSSPHQHLQPVDASRGQQPPTHSLENRLGMTRCEAAAVLGNVYWARTLRSPWAMGLVLPPMPEGERSLLLQAFYNK